MKYKKAKFLESEVVPIAPAEAFTPIRGFIGERVTLNSGGPVGMVVELPSPVHVTVAWDGFEDILPRRCVTTDFA